MTDDSTEALDASDMARLANGHDAALDSLMQRHAEKIFHYLVRQLQNESEAADLAQETFVRVYQSRDRFKPGAKFSTWMYTIATNLVRDRFRWRSRHPQVSLDADNDSIGATLSDALPDSKPGPSDEVLRAERCDTIRRAIAKLPEDLRTALLLFEYEGRSHAEIATVEGCTAKAVESRIHRARNLLRAQLEDLAESS